MAVASALIGALVGGGAYLLTRDDGGKPTPVATGTGSPTVSASPSPTRTSASPSPTSTPTPTPTPIPTGVRLTPVQDPKGFTLLVPDGWQRRDDGTSVFYDSPDRTSLIQVFAMGTDTPYQQAVATDSSLAGQSSRFPGYRRLRLERTADGGAELEYSYDLAGTGVRHTVDHILTGPDGAAWAVLVAGPESGWPTPLRDLLRSELTSFCFTGRCP
ncbi:hypothetical protein [Kitasatospora brasiliensis]|uniref:hypothetical protein n=1 Tax=Kitasatospora brasiliensis TaxID=3058040 RepID=UPI00292DC714|nr:hypothetical protein [Kitasatospora sp. K002]